MARHYNPTIVERLQRAFQFKAGNTLGDNIDGPVAVIPIEPQTRIVKANGATSTGNMSVYTTPSDKDFYLTAMTIGIVKDATCDMATGSMILTGFVDGVSQNLLLLPILTLTAQNSAITLTLAHPLKLDRNTAVASTNSFTAGSCRRTAAIYGYTEEVNTQNT